MRFADFRSFLRESANPFINLCSKIDNSIKLQQPKAICSKVTCVPYNIFNDNCKHLRNIKSKQQYDYVLNNYKVQQIL